jgi:MoaA/NifB/PqqE/SkfB family radical SAM enzyme
MPRLIDESYTLRRLARRLGWRPRSLREEPPERPVGAKLELTHACNLRCGFCYTDSPRHTLSRTPDLADEAWLAIADQAAELGVIEVVLTGGEPFLRRDLVFALLERLEQRGVGLTLNTNGWFVDDAVADRLARLDGLQVDISIDGATPALHDASRGVPGSWRRAVAATGRLLERGVRVQIVHVVVPENERAFPAFLDQMWTLGVTSIRVTPVLQIGAAARRGRWGVSRRRLRRAIQDFQREHGDDMRVLLQSGTGDVLAVNDETAPAAMLVRASGAVLTDSLHPFTFGHAIKDGLATCWQRIVAHWRDPKISRWAGSMRSSRDLPRSDVVPYLDEEVPIIESAVAETGEVGASVQRRTHHAVPEPAKPKDDTGDPDENLTRARAEVRALALARSYRLGAARVGGGPREHYLRAKGGNVVRLNGTGTLVLGALDGGTSADAVDQLAERFTDTDREQLELDVLNAQRALLRAGILLPREAEKRFTLRKERARDVPDATLKYR